MSELFLYPGPINETIIGRKYPKTLSEIGDHISVTDLPLLVSDYLRDQLHPDTPSNTTPHLILGPDAGKRVYVYHSASVTFYAPSDPSGVNGMRRELIRATPSWWSGNPRYDCVFATGDPNISGFQGLLVGRVRLLFSFTHHGNKHRCALVEWFSTYGDSPDEDTGMWVVTPDLTVRGVRVKGVISLDSIVRGAHLIPVFGFDFLPPTFDPQRVDVLDVFAAYYINRFADHHTHTLVV